MKSSAEQDAVSCGRRRQVHDAERQRRWWVQSQTEKIAAEFCDAGLIWSTFTRPDAAAAAYLGDQFFSETCLTFLSR